MKWKIEYDNDTGPGDEGFWEWWTVTDGARSFKCNSEDDAKWLSETLNASTPTTKLTPLPLAGRVERRKDNRI